MSGRARADSLPPPASGGGLGWGAGSSPRRHPWRNSFWLVLAVVGAGALYPSVRRALKPAELLDALAVEGVVTLDGAPLASGCVTFMPTLAEEAGGRPGLARIEPGGAFRVGNANPGRPIKMKPGEYLVTVMAMDENGPAPRLATPPDYADLRRTPLRATLALGPNRVELALRR